MQEFKNAEAGVEAGVGVTGEDHPRIAAEGEEGRHKSEGKEPTKEKEKQAEEAVTVLFPIQHPKLWSLYKTHLSTFWIAEEIDMSADRNDFVTKLQPSEQHFVKMILAFFSNIDFLVLENVLENFLQQIPYQSARMFYTFQMSMENIHSEVYALLLDVLITDASEKYTLFRAAAQIEAVKQKAAWVNHWIRRQDVSLALRLLAFAIVEGVFFSGSFCSIFWLKTRNVCPGLCFSNDFIARDESLHVQFATEVFKQITTDFPAQRPSVREVHHLMKEAIAIEQAFITDAIPVNLIGMNSSLMKQYIEYVADDLLQTLGYPILFRASNPFVFMQTQGQQLKGNFFERRISEYSKDRSSSSSSSSNGTQKSNNISNNATGMATFTLEDF
jgi:ribonucleotide reductase beta subunit family protein with ferritin-like domain